MFSLVVPLLVLCGCATAQKKTEIHNYHEIKDRIINWEYIFEQEENDYYVYFYSEKCGYCNDIKQEVIKFYLAQFVTMYFVCTDYEVVVGPRSDLTDINIIDEFYIFGTPFLARLLNHKISNYYVGVNEIRDFIDMF